MKITGKFITLLSICVFCFGAFYFPGVVWSAPKGTLVIGQGGSVPTMDPHMQIANFSVIVSRQGYDYLVERIYKDGRIQNLPMLATSWEPTDDTTWIFHLRKGVKFHNGDDFTAADVKYSIDRVLDPAQKARKRGEIKFIDHVEILDPHTVKIITKAPAPVLIMSLGFAMPIVPHKYFKEKGDEYVATHPMGSGPFKFVRWIKDEEIVFEANENYWAGPPNIKTLIFKPIPEDSTRVAALMGGDGDIIKKVPTHLIPMINNSENAKAKTVLSALAVNLHLDTVKEGSPLQDKRVRQALNYGVDKESIVKYVLEGQGEPSGSPLTPIHFGNNPNVKPYPYDPEKAKALLKEAGYGNGLTLTLNSPTGRYMKDKEFAEAVADQLSKIGVNVKVKVWEWGNYMSQYSSPEGLGPMYTIGWGGNFDADGVLYPLFHCGEGYSKYCNKEIDTLLTRARSIIDQKEREKIYHQIVQFLHDDAAWLFMHTQMDTYGVSNRVQNWEPTSDETSSLYMRRASVKD